MVEGRGSTGEGVVALGARRHSHMVVLGARSEGWGGKGGARGGERVEEGAWWCSSLVAIRTRVLGCCHHSCVLGPHRCLRMLVLGPGLFVVRCVRFVFVGRSWLCGWSSLVAGVLASSSHVMGGAGGRGGPSSSLVVVVGCCVGVLSARHVCWSCCGSTWLLGCSCAVLLLSGCSHFAMLLLLGCGCHVPLSCESAR